MHFEFSTATRIIFGQSTLQEITMHTSEIGKRAFVITGRSKNRAECLLDLLQRQGIGTELFQVYGEPTIDSVNEGVEKAREARCTAVISIGGGSVVDTGKVIAALLTNSGEPIDYLEVIGRGQKITHSPAYFVAIPTTSGTGSEVTRNAVIKSLEYNVKVSIRSLLLLPKLAIIDPELSYTMPPAVTASTGLDALTQLMEAYVSNRANFLTDGICRVGLRRAANSLERAFTNGADTQAREDMSVASLFGGIALANAKLGAVHGFAGVIGGMFNAPHGVICARLLPDVMEANVHALQKRTPESPVIARYEEIAGLLTGKTDAKLDDGIRWIHRLCEVLQVPHLAEYGITGRDFDTIVEKSQQASSMKGNPITLTDDELHTLLEKAV
jgi:alcohol dehydrogenase class IV